MKKALISLVVLGIAGGGGYWLYRYANTRPEPTVNYATVSRGDILDSVGATGQLEPLDKVQVGTQVSGVILELHADFNSVVRKGQLLAVLDPKIIETQILQAEANLIRAQTDVDRNRVALEDATKKFARANELHAKGIINQAEYDTAEIAVRSAQSLLKSSEASLKQMEASLEQQKLNLEHTRIYSPIDGIVVSRVVDVGQTVQASMQAPVLFNLAADLTGMRVVAGIDEADVGRIRPDQHVTFRIDAYPNEVFEGTVQQVRLEPRLQQNVVTYQAVISAPNRELKLKPGMTANINIQISRKDDVLRVPNVALRFRPTNDMYVALGLQPPADSSRGGRAGTGDVATAGGRPQAGPSPATPPATGVPPDSGGSRDRRSRPADPPRIGNGENGGPDFWPRTQNGSPATRGEAAGARARGAGPGRGAARGGALTARDLARTRNVTTIDALFPPLPVVESRGRVWAWEKDKQTLTPYPLRLGITDGTLTELLEGEITEGMQVVSNIITQDVRPAPGSQGNNPFMPPGRGAGRGPGGGGRGF